MKIICTENDKNRLIYTFTREGICPPEVPCTYRSCNECWKNWKGWEVTDDQRENKLIQLKCPSNLYEILLRHLKTFDIYKNGYYVPLVSEIEWQNIECENSDF